MSIPSRVLAIARSNPAIPVLVVLGLVVAAIPLTNASHIGTGGADIRFDASIQSDVYFEGQLVGTQSAPVDGASMKRATAYELTFTNIPVGNGANVEIRSPDGAVVVPSTPLSTGSDGPGACAGGQSPGCLRNATFLVHSGSLPRAAIYEVHQLGGAQVGALFAAPTQDIPVSISPQVITYQPNTTVVMTVSTGVPGAGLSGENIPPGAVTDPNGDYTFAMAMPSPGPRAIHASLDLGNYANGSALPERTGAGAYTVCDASCPPPSPTPPTPPSCSNCTPPPCSNCTPPPPPPCANCTPTPAPDARFHMGDVRAGVFVPVLAPITMVGFSDFGSATVSFSFDPNVVEVTSVSNGDVPDSNLTWTLNQSAGTVTMLLTTTARPGASGDHTFAVLGLRAVGPVGSASLLNVGVLEAVDSEGADVPAAGSQSTFRAGILGDADSDGDVDAQDATAMADAVVGRRSMASLSVSDADVSGDGALSGRDVMLLRQYLAGTRAAL